MKNRKSLFIFLLPFLFYACEAITGKEVARLPVNFVSNPDSTLVKETTLDLKKDDEIVFWSDMDIEYEGDVQLRFLVLALRDTVVTGNLEIDPTDKDMTMGETRVTLMDKTTWSFSGRNTRIKIDRDGKYTFKTKLVSSENPTLKINKAELVIKK